MADALDSDVVTLDPAAPSEAGLLANLLELYIHDLSAAFPEVELGADGRFGYPRLPLYWSDPSQRFPFLIRQGARVAGFALVMRGSPAVDEPGAFDVAEFFVLRRFRRSGVGRSAARLLWDRLPGAWTVRAAHRNVGAGPFWARVVSEYTGRDAAELAHPRAPEGWQVLAFASTLRSRD